MNNEKRTCKRTKIAVGLDIFLNGELIGKTSSGGYISHIQRHSGYSSAGQITQHEMNGCLKILSKSEKTGVYKNASIGISGKGFKNCTVIIDDCNLRFSATYREEIEE